MTTLFFATHHCQKGNIMTSVINYTVGGMRLGRIVGVNSRYGCSLDNPVFGTIHAVDEDLYFTGAEAYFCVDEFRLFEVRDGQVVFSDKQPKNRPLWAIGLVVYITQYPGQVTAWGELIDYQHVCVERDRLVLMGEFYD